MTAWPLPALMAWAAAWLLHVALRAAGAPAALALTMATAMGVLCALFARSAPRRWIVAAGFPVSALLMAVLGGESAGLPPWAWLLALAALALVYPLGAWRDAPLFPTPARALDGLATHIVLPPGARVLDGGCGLGAGLRALRGQYPQARLEGVEWSWPLRIGCALRCPWASVRRADLWRHDWSGYALVYLFQRPESMAAAAAKAARELAPGAWLASLAFPIEGQVAQAVLDGAGHRLYLYRAPMSGPRPADAPPAGRPVDGPPRPRAN